MEINLRPDDIHVIRPRAPRKKKIKRQIDWNNNQNDLRNHFLARSTQFINPAYEIDEEKMKLEYQKFEDVPSPTEKNENWF